jgi:hypothetical protein
VRLPPQPPVEPVRLEVGDQVRLAHGSPGRWWWTVRAVTENFVACVHQAPFHRRGVMFYTVLDWRNGVRGPCNLIGQGYGDGTYSEGECAKMLSEFERRRGEWPELEVSHRNRVPLGVLETRRLRVPA